MRPVLGEFWDRVGNLRRGLVGDARCRLVRIRDYVDTLLRQVEDNPDPYLK
jgi:aminoglycoside N3'-acetyltransferase